ncbi:MAG: hypothetical protein JOY59_00220 [Candidatus Eremiobacteraeota bacterium]|nr:hypothetical protein [Candidatus Eremiobacteraeota bacterium]
MTLTCALAVPNLRSCPTKKACYTAEVATYDAFHNGHIPPGAHELSANQRVRFAIAAGTTLVPLVLDGIPKSIAFVPSASSTLSGDLHSGFVEPKCSATTQEVSLTAADADGNYIVGPGAPKMTLSSSNPAQFAVTSAGPNAFALNPPQSPAYSFGGAAVPLTATAKPAARSGAKLVSSVFSVAYSGDICGILDEFTIPTKSAGPLQVAAGPDGAVWFTESNVGKIGRITPSGAISEFAIPSASGDPDGIVTGPDGNVWFTEVANGKIGRITIAGIVTEFTPPTNGTPYNITSGPDGNLWFTESSGNNVARITPMGVVKEFPIPTSGSAPRGIVSGPNDALWFAECQGNKIGEISTSGTISEFPPGKASAEPIGIAAGPDGNLWNTLLSGNAASVMNGAGVVISLFGLPASGSLPAGIVAGPDGAMWFTEESGRIGRLTIGGTLTEFPLASGSGSIAFGIATGPDGAIWFAEFGTNKIGRIR